MKGKLPRTLALLLAIFAGPAVGDDLSGLWSYRMLLKPDQAAEPLYGLFLFHEGRFLHQAMHGGEPLDQQLTDAHIGRYRTESEGRLRLDVETGIVVTPAGETLLAGRSDTSHQVTYRIAGDELELGYANGSRETLGRLPAGDVEWISLDGGTLALAGVNFLLVARPDSGWIAGSGRYEREGDRLRLHVLRWFEVRDDAAEYAADRSFEARFDGDTLVLPNGIRFAVAD